MVAIGLGLCFLIWFGGYAVAKMEKNFVEGNRSWLKAWASIAISLFLGVYLYAYFYVLPIIEQLQA